MTIVNPMLLINAIKEFEDEMSPLRPGEGDAFIRGYLACLESSRAGTTKEHCLDEVAMNQMLGNK